MNLASLTEHDNISYIHVQHIIWQDRDNNFYALSDIINLPNKI
jgi:hypothetical protein